MTDSTIEEQPETQSPLPRPLRMGEHLRLAFRDLDMGFADWRKWLLLGLNDIRQRYRRSRLGQFWITMSMAVTILSLGLVYSYLFRTPIHQYLPYLAVSLVVWGLILSIVTESCAVFTSAEGYIRQVPMPRSVFVHRMLVRNLVSLAHNALILPPVFLWFGVPVGWSLPLALPGVVLLIVNGIWVGLLLGTICARFRDLPQIITSLMQVVFFVTPIMWQPAQIPPHLSWLIDLNPFASFLAIIRDPLLGTPPPAGAWMMAGLVTVLGPLGTLPIFARFRARIVYWL
ncbi:MAG TPA: ABC transporter permease [Aliidongia sp.]|nr:ABC transporter permease [Aliidongia sp.]